MCRALRSCLIAAVLVFFTTPSAPAEDATPSETAALQAYREGEFSAAAQLYTKALSETDDAAHRAHLHVYIAWTLFALGREPEVDTHLQAAFVEYPELTIAPDYYTQEFLELFEKARRRVANQAHEGALHSGDLETTLVEIQRSIDSKSGLDGALADVDRLLASFPLDGRLLPLKVQILRLLGRNDQADEILRSYGGSLGEEGVGGRLSIPDLILRANALLGSGDVYASLELLREAVSRQPSNVAALELMAEAAQRAARWQEAEFALKSALGLQPDNIGLRLRLGEVFLAMGDASAARDVFRELTERFPHSDRAWAALGLIDARLGNTERALKALAQALHENPLLPEVQLGYGELLLANRQYSEALEALRAASNLLQSDPQVEARLGQVKLATSQPEAALGHLRSAVAGGFRPRDVQRSLAMALVETGNLSEAERVMADAGPDDTVDHALLEGMLLLRRGNLEEAEARLRRVAEQRPTDVEVLNALAAAVYQQGRYSEALILLERAVGLAPQSEPLEANRLLAAAAKAAQELGEGARTVRPAPSS
jgi:tetratricopeptide (TPR) repeat protein